MRRAGPARRVALGAALLIGALAGPPSFAGEEGLWTPEQLAELGPARLRELGLSITPAELWGPEGGLLEAVIQVGGCSGGFVSAEGLVLTNHHCVVGILQQHSTSERNLLRDGFLAGRRAEELPAAAVRALVPHRSTDVTAEVEAAAARAPDDLARHLALDRKKKELVAACETEAGRRCRVATFDDGVRHALVEAREFRDVRLVWAPPRSVGEFGGEVDNWLWPRHTGDFALVRVWAAKGTEPARHDAGNLAYRPRRHLRLAREALREGAFVLVAGYPGRTFRSLIAPEMDERLGRFHPARARLFRHRLALVEEAMAGDPAARIALADRAQSLSNSEKNSRGQIEGYRRGGLLARKRAEEEAVLARAAARPEHRGAVEAYRGLERLAQEALATWERDFLLAQFRTGGRPLAMAVTLARWATERAKPDLEREEDYQERNKSRARDELERDQARLHLPTEKRYAADYLARLAALPEGQRLPGVEAVLGADRSEPALARRVEEIYAASRVPDLAERLRMFEETEEALSARRDPLLELGFALAQEIAAMERQDKRREGAVSRLRPVWRRAVAAHAGRPLAHDANSTLRASLAHVRGYRPRDGVVYEPWTRLAGVVAKHTAEEPFDVPEAIREKAPEAARSRWADPVLGDVPVCFLADADTTGGSSGGPVLNGHGEVVGVNFDRVWEDITGDFASSPELGRNISADVRYLLWLLEELGGEGAKALLAELGAPLLHSADHRR